MFILVFFQMFTLLLNSLNSTRSYNLREYLIMVVIQCPIIECSYQTQDESCELVSRLLDLHKVDHEKNSGSSKSVSMQNEPQLIWPSLDCGVSQKTWLAFMLRWEAFKIGSKKSSQNASIQLFHCEHNKLGGKLN